MAKAQWPKLGYSKNKGRAAIDGRSVGADGAADKAQPSWLGSSTVAYCWAALRTLAILVGVFVGLLVLAAIASSVVNAFLYTFEAGCLAHAFVFGVFAIFGHQLVRVSKMPRPQRIGGLTRNCSGTAAILALASFAVDYGYSAVKDSRQAAAHGPWEQYQTKTGMFDDLIPKRGADRAESIDTTPSCDDALVTGYRASRAEAAALPPPPPGFVLDGPASRTRVSGVVTTPSCLAPVNADPYAAFSTKTARVFRLEEGWEIRTPADTRDEDVLRVFDSLPASAVLAAKSR
jgi:hypothetical protein